MHPVLQSLLPRLRGLKLFRTRMSRVRHASVVQRVQESRRLPAYNRPDRRTAGVEKIMAILSEMHPGPMAGPGTGCPDAGTAATGAASTADDRHQQRLSEQRGTDEFN